MALLAFGGFVYFWLNSSLRTAVDTTLQLSAEQAVAAVTVENGVPSLSDTVPDSARISALSTNRLTMRILNPLGHVIQAVGPYRDLPMQPGEIASAVSGGAAFLNLTPPGEHDAVRFYNAPITEDGQIIGTMQVGQSLDTVQDTLNRLLEGFAVGVPLLVVVAAAGGYVLAAQALAPIDAMTRTAQRISAEDLHARLGLPPSNDEVGRLAATFDGMLARLEGAFERERRFTADASHELRTPLAAMQAILGVTREQRRTPAQYEQALDDLTTETHRLRSLVEDLLHMARSERPSSPNLERIDLSIMLADVVESLEPLAEAKGLHLTAHIADRLIIDGDSDNLIRLWLNLIDNAVKYTERGTVALTASTEATAIRITVSDSGIGIAPADLPRLFDRFYRVDSARSNGGTGLGLAIAQEIVAAHDGTIAIESTPAVGTLVTVVLPHAA